MIGTIVFPAHAGMFRCDTGDTSARSSFPRARGDVPLLDLYADELIMFSPRTRGCSSPQHIHPQNKSVFPAHAGMFRRHATPASTMCAFSPRTRGCSSGSGR